MSEKDSSIPRSLIDSVRETFGIQASTPIRITDVALVMPDSLNSIDLIAAIGMKSSESLGTLALCFPEFTFLKIVEKMLGEKHTGITAENADAAGELLNIIYASARVKMNEAGNNFEPAIPTVTRGKNLQMSHSGVNKVIRLMCSCEYGDFCLEVSLKQIK